MAGGAVWAALGGRMWAWDLMRARCGAVSACQQGASTPTWHLHGPALRGVRLRPIQRPTVLARCLHGTVLQVLRIDAIPSKSLDTIKDWLNSVSIKYYESKLNLAWKPILK